MMAALDIGSMFTPAGAAKAPLLAMAAAGGRRGGGAGAGLAMDEASRLARQRQLGYAEEPFYRGEATGTKPTEFPKGAFFSRDRDTAAGFAERGGAEAPAEYRLNLGKSFNLNQPVTAESYARLVAQLHATDPQLAASMVNEIAPERGIDWFMEFARRNPNVTAANRGALVHQMIERGSRDPVGTFVRAGFDAIDSGRDVRKLVGGEGIRSKDAVFDPARAKERDIMASILMGLGVPPLAAAVSGRPSQD